MTAWSSLTADVLEELVDLVDDHDGRTPLGNAVLELHRVRLAVLRDDPGPAFAELRAAPSLARIADTARATVLAGG